MYSYHGIKIDKSTVDSENNLKLYDSIAEKFTFNIVEYTNVSSEARQAYILGFMLKRIDDLRLDNDFITNTVSDSRLVGRNFILNMLNALNEHIVVDITKYHKQLTEVLYDKIDVIMQVKPLFNYTINANYKFMEIIANHPNEFKKAYAI